MQFKLNKSQLSVLEDYENGRYSMYVDKGWINPKGTYDFCPALVFMLWELSTSVKHACKVNTDPEVTNDVEKPEAELDACFHVLQQLEEAISNHNS
jgi:hypothetical protein